MHYADHTLDTGSIHASTVLYKSTLRLYISVYLMTVCVQSSWKQFCLQKSGSTTPSPVEGFLIALGKTLKVIAPP